MQYTKTVNTIHILNPAAGKGRATTDENEACEYISSISEYSENRSCTKYVTKSVGDAESFVYECCKQNPATHFVVHGGDGTINEVANGILRAKAMDTATFSVIPFGTGNDFIKNFANKDEAHSIDIIKYNERFSVNMINIGFDCNAADETQKLKRLPFVSGSIAYILGLLKVFFRKMGQPMEITYTDENDEVHTVKDNILLCALANGSYCGGGFKSSPISELNDGIMEILIVRKLPRIKFVMMVGKYRRGTHIDEKTLLPVGKLSKYLTYKKCKKVSIKNINKICVDGEIEKVDRFDAEISPSSITYVS